MTIQTLTQRSYRGVTDPVEVAKLVNQLVDQLSWANYVETTDQLEGIYDVGFELEVLAQSVNLIATLNDLARYAPTPEVQRAILSVLFRLALKFTSY